jgi:hypothetical protein
MDATVHQVTLLIYRKVAAHIGAAHILQRTCSEGGRRPSERAESLNPAELKTARSRKLQAQKWRNAQYFEYAQKLRNAQYIEYAQKLRNAQYIKYAQKLRNAQYILNMQQRSMVSYERLIQAYLRRFPYSCVDQKSSRYRTFFFVTMATVYWWSKNACTTPQATWNSLLLLHWNLYRNQNFLKLLSFQPSQGFAHTGKIIFAVGQAFRGTLSIPLPPPCPPTTRVASFSRHPQ